MNDERNAIGPAATSTPTNRHAVSRRRFVARATAAAGLGGLREMDRQGEAGTGTRAPISPRESIRITKLRLIAGMAGAYYVPIAPHNPQGPCALAAGCQIAAAIPNFLIQERGTSTHENLLKVPFKVENGYLPLPKGPDLGIEIDEDKLLAQVGEPREYPQTYDKDDGFVVDWWGRIIIRPCQVQRK